MCLTYCLLCILCALHCLSLGGPLQQAGCKLNVTNSDKCKFLPLVLSNRTTHFDLVIPRMGKAVFSNGDRMTLACTGVQNYIKNLTLANIDVTCKDNTLLWHRRRVAFDDLECKKDIRGKVRKIETTSCGNGGTLFEIGYNITTAYTWFWVSLIRICYDDNTGRAIYTQHKLYGAEIAYASKNMNRPSFSTDGVGIDIPTVAYTQAFQKTLFSRLLGSTRLARNYINNKSYLVRGHLSPDADFLTSVFKRSTYYYVNVCPQWQVINGGNWKSVEIAIRKTAERYKTVFKIATGTYGILSLPDINNNLKPLHLTSKNKLPVPELVWKIVYHSTNKTGVAIVVMNNPFTTAQELICNNICEQSGWTNSNSNWNNFSRGFVYCCELEQFFRVVTTAPYLEDSGVLRGFNT